VIYFAGNQKRSYGDAKMRRNFDVLSRLEILRTLADEFPSRVSASLVPADGHRSAAGGAAKGDRRIVISDSRVSPVAPQDWLATLASSEFFLCCPGSSQPTCHHLVEAMSVGAIPILEYGDRVTPRLVDGETAICFRGRRGLVEAIKRIDRLDPQQIAGLRRNVARFYDQHLCGTRFLAGLRDGDLDLSSRSVCMPFHEHNFYQSRRSVAA
jgi:hypothetical protein